MGLFRKKSKEIDPGLLSDDPDYENMNDMISKVLGTDYDALLRKNIQMDLDLNKSIIKCKKCGSKFTYNEGWKRFQSMMKESATFDSTYSSTAGSVIICDSCFSIFTCFVNYEQRRMDLREDVTHKKEKLLQEKYL
ncbi:MAG: hypothetical protein LBL07_13530 [Tannerella sp.]|jgi:hypothetical protein|nr:hypothetical protein [Tannerella sp.]